MDDNSMCIQQWLNSSWVPGSSLWAIVTRTNGAPGLKAWYELDGSATPAGLYRGTAYEQWHAVQPLLIKVGRYSPFLQWVEKTDSSLWGWLAISHLNEKAITDHLRALTQIILPDGNTVFFATGTAAFCLRIFHGRLRNGRKFCLSLAAIGSTERQWIPRLTQISLFAILHGGKFLRGLLIY